MVLSGLLIIEDAPFGHDEAVYALKARANVEGADTSFFWADYRAPGLASVLSAVPSIVERPAQLRWVVVVFGLVLIVLTWLVGRAMFDPLTGVVASAGTAVTPLILASATSVWPDVPGAALGLGVLAILVMASRGRRVRWWVLAAAPLAGLATFVRFGAPLTIAVGAVGLAVWRWETVKRSAPQVTVLLVLTGLATGAVLLWPPVVGASTSPLAATMAQSARNDFAWYQGLIDYVQLSDFLLLTPAGLLLAGGLVAGALQWRTGGAWRSGFLTAATIGLASALAVALTLHGEYRYLVPAVPWLWIAAAVGLAGRWRQFGASEAPLVVALVAVAVVFGSIADSDIEVGKSADRYETLRLAAMRIDEETADGSCGVITSYLPQVAWYSRCATALYSAEEVRLTAPSFPPDPSVYLLVVQDGKRQPDGDLLEAYRAEANDCVAVSEMVAGRSRIVEVCSVDGE